MGDQHRFAAWRGAAGRIASGIVLSAAIGLSGAILASTPVGAQEVKERKSILEKLFGKPKFGRRTEEAPVPPPKKKRKSVVNVTLAPGAGEPQPVVKAVDAKKVLVAGDFMAKALGDGLVAAFATSADIVIEPRSNGSSGLVRQDFFDWQTQLPAMIGEIKPAAIVIMLGANDRQQMSVDGVREKFRSEAWTRQYEARIDAITKVAADAKVPLVWVGLPPFASPQMSADSATFNSSYRIATEKVSGQFVDIWDGFADENGKFVVSGSDINGQSVRLRGSDGLSFTKAGKRKLAFYVEKPLRQLVGNPAPSMLRLSLPAVQTGDTRIPESVAVVSVPPISLSDPELDGTGELMGARLMTASGGTTARDLLVEKGDTGDAHDGRVDDFRIRISASTAK